MRSSRGWRKMPVSGRVRSRRRSCARSSRGTLFLALQRSLAPGESHAAERNQASRQPTSGGCASRCASLRCATGEHRTLRGSGEPSSGKPRRRQPDTSTRRSGSGSSSTRHAAFSSTTAEISGFGNFRHALRGSGTADAGAIARAKVDSLLRRTSIVARAGRNSRSHHRCMTPRNAPPGALRRRDVTKRHFVHRTAW